MITNIVYEICSRIFRLESSDIDKNLIENRRINELKAIAESLMKGTQPTNKKTNKPKK